mmetsp:Transcript_8199/g.12581  ORF Transcript_8199/g.12581 Transcript_8199/m.12581 type:complete len:105 (+) Transcript_8199:552-866(+)
MEKDMEVNQFALKGKDHKMFFDKQGDAYVTEGKTITICKQAVRLRAFDVEKVNSSSSASVHFSYGKGHRFDYKNHNWILFNEYLSLSFSYMTLVMRGQEKSENF